MLARVLTPVGHAAAVFNTLPIPVADDTLGEQLINIISKLEQLEQLQMSSSVHSFEPVGDDGE